MLIPANTLTANSILQVQSVSRHSCTAVVHLISYRVRLGTTGLTSPSIAFINTTYPAVAKTDSARMQQALCQIRTAGVNGTVIGQATETGAQPDTGLGGQGGLVKAVNTTIDNNLYITYLSGNANASDTFDAVRMEFCP